MKSTKQQLREMLAARREDEAAFQEAKRQGTVVKYPRVKVKLTGTDGNAFALLGKVREAMRKAKVPAEEIKAVMDEAMSGDYDNLLRVLMNAVDVR